MKTRKMLCALIAALLMALWAWPALAKVPSAPKEFYYLDQANVLSEETEGEIFFSNQLLNAECGAQIVVVTTRTTGSEAIDDYSYELFNQWGIGDSERNNGFLLVLAIDDEDYYAVCGANLQPKFTSSVIKRYFDETIETDYAAGRYDSGVKKFFEAVFRRIADVYNASATTSQGIADYKAWKAQGSEREPMAASGGGARFGSESSGGGMWLVIFVLILIFVIVLMMGRARRRRTVVYQPTYGYGGSGFIPFMLGRLSSRRAPPPPPPPQGPGVTGMPGAGGYRGAPQQPRSSSPGMSGFLSGLLRSSGGSGRSSGGFGRSSGGFRSFGGGSFGSGRGGGGFTRGGGAGRGRH